MDFLEAVKRRRSIRRFKPDPVPEQAIAAMIEAARLAPSGGNGQGWLFGVVTDKEQIEKLARAGGNQGWIATAPLVFALCGKVDLDLAALPEDDFGLEVNRWRFGHDFVEYMRAFPDQCRVAMLFNNAAPLIPGEHIALAAASMGLGSCWIGYVDVREASAILGLPPGYACLFLMPVGYADAEPRPQSRKQVAEIAFRDRWGGESPA